MEQNFLIGRMDNHKAKLNQAVMSDRLSIKQRSIGQILQTFIGHNSTPSILILFMTHHFSFFLKLNSTVQL
jgi:hypothetical protein